jgi:hypothetical protein
MSVVRSLRHPDQGARPDEAFSHWRLDTSIELAGTDVRGIGVYVFRIFDAGGLVHEDFFGTNNGTEPSRLSMFALGVVMMLGALRVRRRQR